MTIEELLLHKHTQEVAARIANGEHPKTIAISLAGNLVSSQLSKLLKVEEPKKAAAKVVEVKVEKKGDSDIIDAEFREVK